MEAATVMQAKSLYLASPAERVRLTTPVHKAERLQGGLAPPYAWVINQFLPDSETTARCCASAAATKRPSCGGWPMRRGYLICELAGR